MSIFKELKRRNVIRVGLAYALIAWVLLQAADFGFDLVGAPNWLIQSLSVLALIGLPVALVYSWVYEMTPEGIKLEKDIDRATSITPTTGRKLDRIIIGFLAVTVAFLVGSNFYGMDPPVPTSTGDTPDEPSATAETQIPSIAVLPFVDMSPEGDQAYFADGISEEILNVLVKTNGIKVTGRTSSFQFRGTNQDLREIGQQLGVENILEGSLRKSKNRIRITAQLVKAEDGFHLWSETYDRELDDIFAVQDEIARAIADALAVQLELGDGQLVEASTTNMEAYEKYLTARSLLANRTDFNLIRSLLTEATTLDPDFAPAWAAFAQAHALSFYYEPINNRFAFGQAEVMAQRALELDPNLSQAHSVLGDVYRDRHDYIQATHHYETALALNPSNIEANQQFSQLLMRTGHFRQALKYGGRSMELDPLSWINMTTVSVLNYLVGQHALSRELLQQAMELAGEARDFQVRSALYIALFEGDFERAQDMTELMKTARRQETQSVFFDEHLQGLLDRLDDPEAALEFIRTDTTARYDMGALSLWLVDAVWASYFGDNDLASDILGQGINDVSSIDGSWMHMPNIKAVLQQGPDLFHLVMVESNMDDFWRVYGYPDFCRPLGEDDFECD